MDMRELISNQTDFALSLSKHVGSTVSAGANLALSPTTLHVILALIATGSTTLDQIFSLSLSKYVESTVAAGASLALSPTNLHAILALIAAGSKGPTLDQILSLSLSKYVGSTVTPGANLALSPATLHAILALIAANGVWVDSSMNLKRGFKEIVIRDSRLKLKLLISKQRERGCYCAEKKTHGTTSPVGFPQFV